SKKVPGLLVEQDIVDDDFQAPGLEEAREGIANSKEERQDEAPSPPSNVGIKTRGHARPRRPLPHAFGEIPSELRQAVLEGAPVADFPGLFHQISSLTRSTIIAALAVQRCSRLASSAAAWPRPRRRPSSMARPRMAFASASGSPGSTRIPVSPERTSSLSC